MFNKKKELVPESRKQELLAKVGPIIAKQLGIDLASINLSSKLVDDLGADSLDSIELVMAIEEEFGIEIPDEAAEKMVTIEDIIQYLAKTVISRPQK